MTRRVRIQSDDYYSYASPVFGKIGPNKRRICEAYSEP